MPRKKKAANPAEAGEVPAPRELTTPLAAEAATPGESGGEPNGRWIPARDVPQAATEPAPAPPTADGRTPERTPSAATQGTGHAADPRPVITVNLSDYSGGPVAHLQRSYRFRQMQIRFDQGQPDERHLAMLQRAGWTDRTQSEGVWTKQIDPQARWQSVARMEQEFKAVANAIRKERGMQPVLEGLTLA